MGVPITPSNSGKDQRDVVMKVIKDWKFEPYILGLGFDTTSDNTGWRKGSVKLIEEALKEAACPHHYYEIYVRKMAEHYLGDTTRSCYELSLALVWLGVKVENFKFLYPGAISHARFLMQSVYSMKIFLLSTQLGDVYTKTELEQIKDVAMFVGLFHASWYFRCPIASQAPMLHLHTISQMKRVEKYMPELAQIVLDSISLHLWYITPQSIPLALVDETLTMDQRSMIAVKLLKIPRPAKFALGKPSFPDLSSTPDKSCLRGKLPDLSSFLGPQSWLLFSTLGISDEDME